MKVELIYGGAMWDKPTGTLRVSGLALPTGSQPKLGDLVEVSLAGVDIAQIVGGRVIVTSWVCTPTGYQFAGEKVASPDIGGAVGSVFECYAMYLDTLGVDISIQMGIDVAQLQRGTSPHPNIEKGWYSLASAIKKLGGGEWTIPEVTNVPVEYLALNGYENSSVIVGSMVAGANKLYLVDGFENIVTKMTAITSVPSNASSISFGTHFGEIIETSGGAADPVLDPRPDECDYKLRSEIRTVDESQLIGNCSDNFSSSIYCDTEGAGIYSSIVPSVSMMGIFIRDSNNPWVILANKASASWTRKWGPKYENIPIEDLSGLSTGFLDQVYKSEGISPVKEVVTYYNTILTETIPLYNLWFNSNVFQQTSYSFKNLYGMSNPAIYQSPITNEELSVTVIDNGFYNSMLKTIDEEEFKTMDSESKSSKLELKLPAFSFYGITETTNVDGDINTAYMDELIEKMQEEPGLVTCSLKSYVYSSVCQGDMGLGSVPYLFRRLKEIRIDYRVSPVVLNFNSEFWNTPDANKNIFAVDSRGQRIWIFPHDNMEVFCRNMITSRLLRLWWKEVPPNRRPVAVSNYLSVVQLLKSNITMAYYLSDLLNIKLNTDEVDQWRRFLNELSGWIPDPLSQLLNTASAVSQQSAATESAAISYREMRNKHPDLINKVKKKAPFIDNALNYTDEATDDKAKTFYVTILNTALTWMLDYGSMRNLEGLPIAINKSVVSYGLNSRTVVTENLITGDKHSSEEVLPSGGSMLYATPAQVKASTSENPISNVAVTTENTRISNWDLLKSFNESMSDFAGKKLVFYSLEDKFPDAKSGYSEVISLLDQRHIRNVRLNVSNDGRARVSHSLMGIMDEEKLQ